MACGGCDCDRIDQFYAIITYPIVKRETEKIAESDLKSDNEAHLYLKIGVILVEMCPIRTPLVSICTVKLICDEPPINKGVSIVVMRYAA
jgi:hypothetical protein